MHEEITPDDAAAALGENRLNELRRITEKVKAGKPLTKSEQALLQNLAPSEDGGEGGWNGEIRKAKNLTELADTLGVTRQSLTKWRKEPGAPKAAANGMHDVAEWRDFLRRRNPDIPDTITTEESEALKYRKLLAEVNEKEFKNEVRKGRYIEREVVRQAWYQKTGRAASLLRSKLEKELPPLLAGQDAPTIQVMLGKVIDEFMGELHEPGANSVTP